jgi:hypothetical protein
MQISGADKAASVGFVSLSIPSFVPTLTPELKSKLIDVIAAHCRRGICFRPRTSITIKASIPGRSVKTETFAVPDPRRVVLVPLRSGVFETQTYSLTFDNGVRVKQDQKSRSELVGLAELPFKLVKTALTVPGEILGLRADKLQSEADYLTKIKTVLPTFNDTRTLCTQNPSYCTDSARKILKLSTGPDADNAGDEGVKTPEQQAPAPTNPKPQEKSQAGETTPLTGTKTD